jgi:hypothetical protein
MHTFHTGYILYNAVTTSKYTEIFQYTNWYFRLPPGWFLWLALKKKIYIYSVCAWYETFGRHHVALARSTQWVHPSQRFQVASIHPTSICRVLRKTLSCLSLGDWEQDFYCGSSELLVNVKDTPQIKILRVHLHDYCNRIITQYKPVVMEYTAEIYGLSTTLTRSRTPQYLNVHDVHAAQVALFTKRRPRPKGVSLVNCIGGFVIAILMAQQHPGGDPFAT